VLVTCLTQPTVFSTGPESYRGTVGDNVPVLVYVITVMMDSTLTEPHVKVSIVNKDKKFFHKKSKEAGIFILLLCFKIDLKYTKIVDLKSE